MSAAIRGDRAKPHPQDSLRSSWGVMNDFLMRLFRWALVTVLLVVLAVAIQQTLLWLGVWGNPTESQVKELKDGDQEIALIEPATSADVWGRLVTAAKLIELDWPKINPTLPALKISLADAFPPLTAEVPEIVFSFADAPSSKLRLRWYKISGEHDAASWVGKLRARSHPPLAVIGGGTSDRAIKLAYDLRNAYDQPEKSDQPSPVFLITTATSEETKAKKSLIGVYKDRSFRFSFTNQKMVEALLEFVQHRQYPENAKEWGAGNLWTHKPADPQPVASAVIGVIGVMRGPLPLERYTMHAVSWEDERYSLDMKSLFDKEFKKRYPRGEFSDEGSIPSGVGGFFHPAAQEQYMVATFLARPTPIAQNSFLVLPTQTVRMRRFLINLRQRSPQDARNLVILNGDAITFHSVYRDRDVMWNILDLPYSLVFFAHRNPVDRAAGFRGPNDDRAETAAAVPPRSTTGTHDLLLYRDLIEAILYASYDQGKWLDNPTRVRDRLRTTCWYHPPDGKVNLDPPRVCNPEIHQLDAKQPRFFDAAGNRQNRTGEHIVWLKPNFTDDKVDLKSTISVWTIRPDGNGAAWQHVDSFDAYYNQSRLEDGQP